MFEDKKDEIIRKLRLDLEIANRKLEEEEKKNCELLKDQIILLNEREACHRRIAVLTARVDEALEEFIKVSSRLIKAKDEYRKLRDTLGGAPNGNVR